MTITDEIVLPIRVEKNPRPPFNHGGDCGACVAAALAGIALRHVYDCIGSVRALDFAAMETVFTSVKGRIERTIFSNPKFKNLAAFWSFYRDPQCWYDLAHGLFEAGYYMLATVDATRNGTRLVSVLYEPLVEDCLTRELASLPEFDSRSAPTNHWILVCGAGLVDGVPSILISDSSHRTPLREEWVSVDTFINKMNGLRCVFVKPKVRKEYDAYTFHRNLYQEAQK